MTSELRQRHQSTSQSSKDEDVPAIPPRNNNSTDRRQRFESVTELPALQENGQPATERTEIPTYSHAEEKPEDNSDDGVTGSNKTQQQVAKSEGKKRKIAVRIISSVLMIAVFLGLMNMGHLYICILVALVELLLFRELVKVRYSAYFNTIQDTIPLFRTTQWLWFAVAIFYTYGDFFREIIIQGNPAYHWLSQYAHYLPSLSFLLYSGTFVMTIATMQVGHIKFQLNQLCWTILVLCLTVGQLKYIMHNIFNGFFWFALPILLVVTNDIMAYVSGMTCGRKFIRRPFISFSPNKTWEGFIGGGLCTMVAAWYISKLLAQFPWMHCPTNKFEFFPPPLQCTPDPIFVPSTLRFPSQMFELFPRWCPKLFPNVVEICSVVAVETEDVTTTLTPCVSGDKRHTHHHFELLMTVFPVQIHALVLALFASLVAPFGGFLASAIKRAYRLKDFDSLIPGHGGVMDRMDCQFLMALCTWVHYNTFVKIATISVHKMTYMYNQLTEEEKREFLESITLVATKNKSRNSNNNNNLRLDESFL
ncbi:Phosphatidate cytidylyltransferase 1 [Seminavis robusta]|uniref:phosphatidate cytidylyltransferase n=1 Tax=Seminavis robusta TaxID=568900 RepID=A0A9N8DKV1_9STRA|nr:Phosphatidate cytidylyltransferase 1 [Seminavis robusta]|eukprot:Sro112_g055830.1 Phosphatidate cytidylyltransferase 1 (534) ;mRNA; r:94508-96299